MIETWRIATDGATTPSTRCYWVMESLLLAGAYPESPNFAERGRRVERLWRAGIRTFVNLVEERERDPSGEKLLAYAPAVAALAARAGEDATCVRLPIRDLSVPSVDAMRTILDVIDLSLRAQRPVYVHCLGGVGRTGTVVGTWLRRHRFATRENVLDLLARLRRVDTARADRPAPETSTQREMVLSWTEVGAPIVRVRGDNASPHRIIPALEGRWTDLPERLSVDELTHLAHFINGYEIATEHLDEEAFDLARRLADRGRASGRWEGSALELLAAFFATVRGWRGHYEYPRDGDRCHEEALALHAAVLRRLREHPEEVAFMPDLDDER